VDISRMRMDRMERRRALISVYDRVVEARAKEYRGQDFKAKGNSRRRSPLARAFRVLWVKFRRLLRLGRRAKSPPLATPASFGIQFRSKR
jgi:hypothetical protein